MSFARSHFADTSLLQNASRNLGNERSSLAHFLADVAELDRRRLYLPQGHSSMYEFCVRKLGLSEDSALKRIRAPRAARRFPIIFYCVADGRLHLSGIVELAPHLTEENARDLLAAAAHRSKRRLEFDHVDPYARGGRATVATIRLRCRAHNQYEADQVFGERFMDQKRHAGRNATI